MVSLRQPSASSREDDDQALDRFMPQYDVVERHHVRVQAPAAITFAAAKEMDLYQHPVVRAIFKTRELILGALPDQQSRPRGIVDETKALGWVVLHEIVDREIVMGAYTTGARQREYEVDIVRIATVEFPFARSRDDLESRAVPRAVADVQELLKGADHIVLIYPLWNGGLPALVRAFFEQVFRSAFIFPDVTPGERLGFSSYFSQRKGLSGRSGRIVTTMQMPAFVYRWYFRPHQERNALRVSGIRPVRETLIGMVEAADSRARERWLSRMAALGQVAA